MDKLYTKALGKINLSLDVIGKRPDGYHDLKMVMQTVELHDVIEIEKAERGINICCSNPLVPDNNSNIAYKAAAALSEYTHKQLDVTIKIDKNIPVAAGMAGGSSDAAAVLKGINQLYELGISFEELLKIGKTLGSDVPYCLYGGTMLAEGTGDVLTSLAPYNGIDIVLVKPKIEVSTAWVYKNYDASKVKLRPDTESLIAAISTKDIKSVAAKLGNVLESVTVEAYPIIDEIKKELVRYGASGSLMSGSGPTVFGIFGNNSDAKLAFERISNRGQFNCYLTKTIC